MPQGAALSFDDLTPVSSSGDALRFEDLMPAPASSQSAGLLSAGNIDLAHRPRVQNADGTVSTVRSMSFNQDGREILVPTVSDDGRILSNDEAIRLYRQTGKHLGIFDTPEHATAYAQQLHEQQAAGLEPAAPGVLGRAWQRANRPTLPWVSRKVQAVGDWLDQVSPTIGHGVKTLGEWIDTSKTGHALADAISAPSKAAALFDAAAAVMMPTQPIGAPRGFVAGATEGAGDVAASFSSLVNLAMLGTGMAAERAAVANLPRVVAALRGVEGAGGAAFAAEGAHRAVTADTWADRLAGVGEMAGGAAGAMHATGVRGRLPFGRRTEETSRPAEPGVVRETAAVEPTVTNDARTASPMTFDDLKPVEEPAPAAHTRPVDEAVSAPREVTEGPLNFSDLTRVELPSQAASMSGPSPDAARGRVVPRLDDVVVAEQAPSASPEQRRGSGPGGGGPKTATEISVGQGSARVNRQADSPQVEPFVRDGDSLAVGEQPARLSGNVAAADEPSGPHALAVDADPRVASLDDLTPVPPRPAPTPEVAAKLDAPVPKTFADLPAVERREVRRIAAELEEFQFDQPGLQQIPWWEQGREDAKMGVRLPNASVFHTIKADKSRSGPQIRQSLANYIAGRPVTTLTADIVRTARRRAYGDLNVEGAWQLPPEAGHTPGDYIVSRRHTEGPAAEIETRAADAIERNPGELRAQYFAEHGNVINADTVRAFIAKRAGIDDPHAPARYQALKEPVSTFGDSLYEDLLSQPTPEGKARVVVLTGGGTGSGKSVETSRVRDHVHAVFDSTLSNPDAARGLIQQALSHGLGVDVRFVYRDPVEAFRDGVIPRYQREGRPVPIADHVNSHTRAADAILQLVGEFGDNPDVQFTPVLSQTGLENTTMRPEEFGRALMRYPDGHGLQPALERVVADARRAGRLSSEEQATLTGADRAVGSPQRGVEDRVSGSRGRVEPDASVGPLGPQDEAVAPRPAARTGLPWTSSPSTADTASQPPRGPSDDLLELHGGIGAIGRLFKTGESAAPEPAPSPRARDVRTLDPPTAGEPAPAATPMPEAQRRTGITLKGFDPTIRPALRELLDQHDGFAAQRRDVQSRARTQKLSEAITVDVSKPLPKGRVLNAEETTAVANTLATLTDRIARLAEQAKRGALDDVGRLRLEEARAAQASVMQSLWGTVTEQGRALNAWKSAKRVLETHDDAFITEATRHARENGDSLAETLTRVGDDPVKQYEWLRDQARARRSVPDTVTSYFYANILSGVATHERNILSNSSNLVFGVASDLAAGRVGETRANVAGMWDALTAKAGHDGPYAWAMPRAFQEVYFNLSNGFSPTDVHTGKLDFGHVPSEFAGGGRNPFNWPTRALNAADGFFRALVNQGERYRAAYAIAKRGGEGSFESRMADALADLPPEARREVEEMTSRAVFQETPGAITQAFLKLRNTVPGMRFVVPFVRIAANLTRQGAEFSPAGFGMQSARRAGRVGEAARAKAAMGSVALLPIAYYAASGKITGSGPSDPGARQAWLDSGKRPNSILNPLTGQWVNYSSWQPVALPMSVVANAIESFRDAEASGAVRRPLGVTTGAPGEPASYDAWAKLAEQTVLRTADSVLQQSFLSGVSSLLDALNDPARSAERFFTTLAQGFVPMSGAMRTVTQTVDPVTRTPSSARQGVAAVVPWASKRLPPLVDRFGQETTSTSSPWTRGFYQASPAKNDPLQPLLDRAGVEPTRPSGTLRSGLGAVTLSDDEQTALKKARGQARRRAYEDVRTSLGGQWSSVPPEDLRNALVRRASEVETAITRRANGLKQARRPLTVDDLLGTAVAAVGGR